MSRQRPTYRGGPPCPADPTHGELVAIPGVTDWYCPNQIHDGIPHGPDEYRVEPTRNRWTLDEVTA